MTPTNSGDMVALAVDRATTLKELANAYNRSGNATNPFTNVVFMKNAIASGSIVPPSGESANVRRTDYMVGLCVICFVVLGASCIGAFFIASHWR